MDIMQDVKTAELVREYNLRLTKSLGQNFIVDHSVTRDIVNGADLTDETCARWSGARGTFVWSFNKASYIKNKEKMRKKK